MLCEKITTPNLLQSLSYAILQTLAEQYKTGNCNIRYATNVYDRIVPSVAISDIRLPISIRESSDEDFLTFIKTNENLRIKMRAQVDTGFVSVDGEFFARTNLIELRVTPQFMDKFDETFDPHKLGSVLTHELTHAYDNWISKEKYTHNKLSMTGLRAQGHATDMNLSPEDRVKHIKAYRGSPHEINARFYQSIHTIPTPNTVSLRDFVFDFARTFDGFEDLTSEDRKRILSRVGAYWASQNPTRRSVNLQPIVERLNDKLNGLATVQLKSAGRVSVEVSLSASDTDMSAAIKRICKFADTYHQTVEIESIPQMIAREFDFKKNAGRTKRFDLSVHTIAYREPKPRQSV